jgi:hypothetical protein
MKGLEVSLRELHDLCLDDEADIVSVTVRADVLVSKLMECLGMEETYGCCADRMVKTN